MSFVSLCLNGRNDEEKVRREVRKREENVTLVTAKNQHRCWKARTRVRKTRMCGGFIRFRRRDDFGEGANDKLSLGLSSLETYYAVLLLILESKTRCIKRK